MTKSRETVSERVDKPAVNQPLASSPLQGAWQSPQTTLAQACQRFNAMPLSASTGDILQLQRSLGNRAVGALLGRSKPQRPVIQAKLTVNVPGDQYKREADRVAGQVMRMPTVQEEALDEEDAPEIMAKPLTARASDSASEANPEFEQQLNASRGNGKPLPSSLREQFEGKFGADFSGVRIHANADADRLNQSISAKAFTAGKDVFFRQGAYAPGSRVGQALIAHELTHVVQQYRAGERQTVIQRLYLDRQIPLPGEKEGLQTKIQAYQDSQSLAEGFNHLTDLQAYLQKLTQVERQELVELEAEVKTERNLLGRLSLIGSNIRYCLLGSKKNSYLKLSSISAQLSFTPINVIQGSFALNLTLDLLKLLPKLVNSIYQLAHMEGKTEPWAVSVRTVILAEIQREIMPAFFAIQMPIYLPETEPSEREQVKTEAIGGVAVTGQENEGHYGIDKQEAEESDVELSDDDLSDDELSMDEAKNYTADANVGSHLGTGRNKPALTTVKLRDKKPDIELSDDELSDDDLSDDEMSMDEAKNYTADAKVESHLGSGCNKLAVPTVKLRDEKSDIELSEDELSDDELSDDELSMDEAKNYTAVANAESLQVSNSKQLSALRLNVDETHGYKPDDNNDPLRTSENRQQPGLQSNFAEADNYTADASGEPPVQDLSDAVLYVAGNDPLQSQGISKAIPSQQVPYSSKQPADKARRYVARAQALLEHGNFIGAGTQLIRAFGFNPLVDYALNAAILFQKGGDFERAIFWARKTIAVAPNSAQANYAREYLASIDIPEKAKYQTSGILPVHAGFRQGDLNRGYGASPAKDQKRAMKASGLAKEEMFSEVSATVLETLIALWKAKKITTEELKIKIGNMATGFDPKALANEYIAHKDSLSKNPDQPVPAPMFEQLKQRQVTYLHTSEQRDRLRLGYEAGMIKQGDSPRSPEAEAGYDTSKLSTNNAGTGFAIFIMGEDGDIYADQHRVSQFHHSSFLAGADVAGSGEIKVETGHLKAITNKSGHYAQGAFYLAQVLAEFQDTFKQNLNGVLLLYHTANNCVKWQNGAAGFLQDFQQDRAIFDDCDKNKKSAIETLQAIHPFQGAATQPSSSSAPPTLVATPPQPGAANIVPPVPQPAVAAVPRALPAGSVRGELGLSVSPALIAAVRQDILSSGITSKWADQHEIQALAVGLGIRIIIHNSPSGDRYGAGNNLYELYYSGRDHYDAYIQNPMPQPGYRKEKIPGNGDCFYNAIVRIAQNCKQLNYSVSGLRQIVHDQLSDQNIADIAVPLIRDIKNGQTDGIGINFLALLQNRHQAGVLHYTDS